MIEKLTGLLELKAQPLHDLQNKINELVEQSNRQDEAIMELALCIKNNDTVCIYEGIKKHLLGNYHSSRKE